MISDFEKELIQVIAVGLAILQAKRGGHTSVSVKGDYDIRNGIINEVLAERIRQEYKWGNRTFGQYTPERWHTILSEEVGEVARAILDGKV